MSTQTITNEKGKFKIVSDNKWIRLYYGFQLTGEQREYVIDRLCYDPPEVDANQFFMHDGHLKDLNEYMGMSKLIDRPFGVDWHGYINYDETSGEVIKLSNNKTMIMVGTFKKV